MWFKVPPVAALAGSVVGLLTIVIIYAVGADGEASGGFSMLLAPGGLYSTTCFLSFVLSWLFSFLTTLIITLTYGKKVGYEFPGFPEKGGATKDAVVEVEKA